MEGLEEALQYITGLKAESMEPKLLEINGETYCTKEFSIHAPTCARKRNDCNTVKRSYE